MLWKSVCNWQWRTVYPSELEWLWPVFCKPGSYTDEQAADKHYSKTGGQNISSSLKKEGKHTQLVSAPTRVKSNKRCLTSLGLKTKVVSIGDGCKVSCRSSDSLDCLPSKWSDSGSALPIKSHTSPPLPPTRGGSDEPKPNTWWENVRIYILYMWFNGKMYWHYLKLKKNFKYCFSIRLVNAIILTIMHCRFCELTIHWFNISLVYRQCISLVS